MATITGGSAPISPELVVDYATTRAARNVLHAILSRPDPDVTLRPAATRSGSLRLYFETTAAASAALGVLAQSAVFVLAAPEDPTLGMTFVVADNLGQTTADESQLRWFVDVGYREVVA